MAKQSKLVDDFGRECNTCGEYKTWDEFYVNKSLRTGHVASCKSCVTERSNKHYQDNKENKLEYAKQYREDNKEYIKEWKKQYYEENREDILEGHRGYYKENAERIKSNNLQYHYENSDHISQRHKEYYQQNREYFLQVAKEWAESSAKYVVYGDKLLIPVEAPTETLEGYLEVSCFNSNCRKRFVPTNKAVQHRVTALEGKVTGENNLYCSEECKQACPVYKSNPILNDDLTLKVRASVNTREFQPEFNKLILGRDGNKCQICGGMVDLVAHHIIPAKVSPIEQVDIDNGITLCKTCHNHVHTLPGCSRVDIANMKCWFTNNYIEQASNISEEVIEWQNK
jgi:hypothetical protein